MAPAKFSGLALLFLMLVGVTAASCVRGNNPTATRSPGATNDPATAQGSVSQTTIVSATASATSHPQQTPSPTPTPLPVDRHATNISIFLEAVCINRNDPGREAIGTVPLPTAVTPPIPKAAVTNELNAYFNEMNYIIKAIEWYSEKYSQFRALAFTPVQQIDTLYSQGRRLDQLCSAATARSIPDAALDFSEYFLDILATHKDGLVSDAIAVEDGLERLPEQTVDIARLYRALDFYVAQNGVNLETLSEKTVFDARQLNIELRRANGWIPVRNDTQIILVAFNNQQELNLNGLGPESWDLGTALKIRSLSGRLLDAENEIPTVLQQLLTNRGTERIRSTRIVGQTMWYTGEYYDNTSLWNTFAAIALADGLSYLVEMGCPITQEDSCRTLFDHYLSVIRFN